MKITDTPSIERLKELLAKATPLPWFPSEDLNPLGGCLSRAVMAKDTFIAEVLHDDELDVMASANAELIVAVINALPHLIATLETLTPSAGEVERVEAAIREHCDEHGPSGGAWNVSSMLDLVRRALASPPPQPDIEGRVDKILRRYDLRRGDATRVNQTRGAIRAALSLPTTEIRREALEEAANIAEAIDSGRGNEREIAKAIRSLAKEDGRP